MSENIKRLSMKHNAIKELSFGFPTKCIELDLSHNQISTISSKAFQLRQLEKLHLNGNQTTDKLCDEIISDISSMTELKHLNLSSNNLTEFLLQKWNFEANTTVVDLRKNNITRFIMETETDPLNNFTLMMNIIKYNYTCKAKDIKIHEYILQHVNYTKAELHAPKLKNMLEERKLTSLMCEDNQCPDKCECTMINDVYLIGCFNSSLVTFPSVPSFFSNYKTEIDLSRNNITELPRNFSTQENIIRVNASHNQIQHIFDDNIPKNIELFDVQKNPARKEIIIWMESVNSTNVTEMHFKIVDEPKSLPTTLRRSPTYIVSSLSKENTLTYACLAITFTIAMFPVIYAFSKSLCRYKNKK